jgi:hypothetical protein
VWAYRRMGVNRRRVALRPNGTYGTYVTDPWVPCDRGAARSPHVHTPLRRYADTLPPGSFSPTGGQKSERAREFVHDVEFGAGVPAVVGP